MDLAAKDYVRGLLGSAEPGDELAVLAGHANDLRTRLKAVEAALRTLRLANELRPPVSAVRHSAELARVRVRSIKLLRDALGLSAPQAQAMLDEPLTRRASEAQAARPWPGEIGYLLPERQPGEIGYLPPEPEPDA